MVKSIILNKIYIDNLLQQAKQNQLILQELLYSSYPYNEIRELIKKLIKSIDSLFMKLNITKGVLLSSGYTPELESEIKLYADLLAKIHKLYELLEVSRVENVPQLLVYLLEYLTKKISLESNFILVPTYKNNFIYLELNQWLRSLFELAIDNVDEIFPLTDKKLSILMFPFAYKNTLFSNALLSHEIGHFIEFKYDIVNKLSKNINLDPKRVNEIARKEILRILSQFKKPLDLFRNWKEVEAKTNAVISKIINNWMKELVCDIFAFKMIGPSYIISFIEFILTGTEASEVTSIHPPPALRLNFLLQEYKGSGYQKAFENSNIYSLLKFNEYLTDIENIVTKTVINNETIGELYYYAYEKVQEQKDNIQSECKNISNDLNIIYNYDILLCELNPLIDCLNELIIPCELNRGIPANPISVLNVGVIFKLVKFDELYDIFKNNLNKSKIEFNNDLNDLTMKGLESCLIQNKMGPLLKKEVESYRK